MIDLFKNYKSSFLLVIISLFFVVAGCKQKTDVPADKQTQQISADSTAKVSAADTNKAKPVTYMDVKGKWTGTFDQRSTTLNINSQDSTEFSGTITIAYREPLTKPVSGKFDNGTMKFTMKDTEHSRFQGNYSGEFTNDGKMTGTFTMNLNHQNYNFKFNKK